MDLESVICNENHYGVLEFNLDGFNERIIEGIVSQTRKINEIHAGPLKEYEMDTPQIFISSNRHSSITPEDHIVIADGFCILAGYLSILFLIVTHMRNGVRIINTSANASSF